ncbi:hypothetical protein CGLO_17660 [Colletotrichum gloeosporioides Cg-14]|uniref:Uncharacterized protein n=1 Tax=Colletotrichum gloeosporioides (strain Cg-14) TaxID=1237896 RepID=T0JWB1_COLGC|nr:hypothetical protein CGLO_17660 [Colletotrichum gloeosporioides Cg-14]
MSGKTTSGLDPGARTTLPPAYNVPRTPVIMCTRNEL